jgi:amidohydrolase
MNTSLDLIALRRELHAHPEVSGAESETAARVSALLQAMSPDGLITGLGGHGVLATFDSGKPGAAVLYRCELDALPIQEANGFAHRSTRPGVSHKCGHDGHATIALGLAESLAQRRPDAGRVHVLFQPSEENGAGAAAVLADPKFAAIRPDLGFAMHNIAGLPLGAVCLREGVITAAVSGFALRFRGRTSHASQPELAYSPMLAIADLLRYCDGLNLNDPASPEFQLITPVHVNAGVRAYGITPGDGEVWLTLRAWSDDRIEALMSDVAEHAAGLCSRDGLTLSTEVADPFRANVNAAGPANLVRAAAQGEGMPVIELPDPLKGGEDFGLFTARFPCCMYLIGAGEDSPAMHSPDYDFPDVLIDSGLRMARSVVDRALSISNR